MKIVILAGTLTGNHGSEAMVTTCIHMVRERFPGATICVATYYPREDREALNARENGASDIYIYSCTPRCLVLNWFPGAWFAKAFPVTKKGGVRHFGGVRDLLGADAVLDVAGVSFIDDREKFLPFNVLTLYPFLLHRIPVFKLSQAVGPFESFWNRRAATRFLTRVETVYARGSRTLALIKNSGLPIPHAHAPDVTFCLGGDQTRPYTERTENTVAVLPSSLVMSKHPGYVADMARLIDSLCANGASVTLIAHSWRDSDHPRNNDLVAANAIRALLKEPVPIKGPGMDALRLREEISKHRLAVSSRFHGMIGALETETPVLVIGWSHKYLEVLEDFGFDGSVCFDYRTLEPERLLETARSLLADGPELSRRIQDRLEDVRSASRRQFDEIFSTLEGVEVE
ncbi:MAG: polysaccharide pyruvyl transferase family protein [Kiritimatiellia bacterium]